MRLLRYIPRIKDFTSSELAWFLRKTAGPVSRRVLRNTRNAVELELILRALLDEAAEESGPWMKYAA